MTSTSDRRVRLVGEGVSFKYTGRLGSGSVVAVLPDGHTVLGDDMDVLVTRVWDILH